MMKRLFTICLSLCLLVGCIDTSRYVPPTPGPAPVPVATATDLWVITFDDASHRTVEQGRLLGDLDYWKKVEDRGNRRMQINGLGDDAKPYKSYIDKVGLPCVLFLDKNNPTKNYRGIEKLPKDEPSMDALIKKYGGR